MDDPHGLAAPASGFSDNDNNDLPEIASFEELVADPEIAALLDFEPVPRQPWAKRPWTPELQREFIARLAVHGSPNKACAEMGKSRAGMTKLFNHPQAASFRDAWHRAIALAKRREADRAAAPQFVPPGSKPPIIDHRYKASSRLPGPAPSTRSGQVMNEHGEWEDEDSFQRRGEEARMSICNKLLRCRRLYLQEISSSPGKRAAFEILTELPVDWDKAARLEAQDDEPWARTNQREPDMILTAESGWSFGEHGYGVDKKGELRRAIDEHRADEGLPPVDWDSESAESKMNDGETKSAEGQPDASA